MVSFFFLRTDTRLPSNPANVLAYLWSDLPNGTTIVDVGGGVGSASMEISRAHPHLKFVVQDLPQVVQRGQEVSCISDHSKYPGLTLPKVVAEGIS